MKWWKKAHSNLNWFHFTYLYNALSFHYTLTTENIPTFIMPIFFSLHLVPFDLFGLLYGRKMAASFSRTVEKQTSKTHDPINSLTINHKKRKMKVKPSNSHTAFFDIFFFSFCCLSWGEKNPILMPRAPCKNQTNDHSPCVFI